jgi:hypothetical protein
MNLEIASATVDGDPPPASASNSRRVTAVARRATNQV